MNVGTLFFGLFMVLIAVAVLIFVIYRYQSLKQTATTTTGATGPTGATPTCVGTSSSNFSFSNGTDGLITGNTLLNIQTNEFVYFLATPESLTLQLQANYPPGVVLYVANLSNYGHYLCNICSDQTTYACGASCTTRYWNTDDGDPVSYVLAPYTSYYITFFDQYFMLETKSLFLPPS